MDEQLEQVDDLLSRLLLELKQSWQSLVLSLPKIILALLLLFVVLLVASKVKKVLLRRLAGKAHDPLFATFVAQLSKFAITVVGLLLVLQVIGLTGIASGLLAGAGVSALVFGFAFKDIAENFLAGIILAFNRPFAMHDAIKIEDYLGYVVGLGFRATHIKTFDEKDVYIPNATIIKSVITNMTRDGLLRMDFVVGIAYEDDIAKATNLIVKAVTETKGVLSKKEPFAIVETLNTSTVDLKVFFWTDTQDYRKGVLVTRSDVMKKVKEVLLASNITLPADIQELKLYEKAKAFPVQIDGRS
ncbi:MAG TPA: mechanosensitive ion channel family protein [Flavisolibacter sp.]|jgi:small-conductance mechanosensitive channel|nr:mechanosensitive ion channel family protein [Flavisolibacter sp.]